MNQADRVAKAIDAISANSDHETRTQTEQAASASWMKQLADIGLIVGSIMGAVFFTLLLLSGNTMMQAVRERTSELAVLKTIGFSNLSVLAMVLAESVLLLLLGGVIGLVLAALLIPVVSAGSGGMLNLPGVGAEQLAARRRPDGGDRPAGRLAAGLERDAPEHRRRPRRPLRRNRADALPDELPPPRAAGRRARGLGDAAVAGRGRAGGC